MEPDESRAASHRLQGSHPPRREHMLQTLGERRDPEGKETGGPIPPSTRPWLRASLLSQHDFPHHHHHHPKELLLLRAFLRRLLLRRLLLGRHSELTSFGFESSLVAMLTTVEK
jgi:hypothetical protein